MSAVPELFDSELDAFRSALRDNVAAPLEPHYQTLRTAHPEFVRMFLVEALQVQIIAQVSNRLAVWIEELPDRFPELTREDLDALHYQRLRAEVARSAR